MQIRKTYNNINPALLYDLVKESMQKQGLTLDQNRLETYSMPTDSSTFIYRGTMTFQAQGKEALRVNIIGIDRGETRLLIDSSDEIFPQETITSLESELEFLLGPYEPEE